MNINQKDIMKTAASHLRNLSDEVKKNREDMKKMSFVNNMLNTAANYLTGRELLDKYAEYMDKDMDELKIIEKAIELSKTGELHLGSLSAQVADSGELDPLTALLVGDYLQ